MNISKKYTIIIPNNISIIYCTKKKIITFVGPTKKTSLKLPVQLFIEKNPTKIKVSSIPFSQLSNIKKKQIKSTQGTTVALLKQTLTESYNKFCKNLQFVGVGYRSFILEDFEEKLLLLKLGYSHFIYFKIPTNFKITCFKFTNLFIAGGKYQQVNQLAALVRICKPPEPYKGKGILYLNEQIKLKEGKKI
jgi:large subunit ribosomal protein L6